MITIKNTKYKIWNNGTKAVCFLLILSIGFALLSPVLTPVVYEWNENADTITSFYSQPEDTIETIFLGTSHVECSISPMELYRDYGISAYNLGSSVQPMSVSYYWLKEAYEYQGESLKTVVINISYIRGDGSGNGYDYAFASLKNSVNKLNLAKDYTDTLDDFISCISTVFSFHSRWKEIDNEDFTFFSYDNSISSRGYRYDTTEIVNQVAATEISIPNYILQTEEIVDDSLLDDVSVEYMVKMIEFCEENDLKLVFMQTPAFDWTDDLHNNVQALADTYGIEFYDFNYYPWIEEMDYNMAIDTSDMEHMNYYGADKFTNWFGEYLVEYCDATDIRGIDDYEFMEEELETYTRMILTASTDITDNLYDYIQTVNAYDDFSILITMLSSETLDLQFTDTQRKEFASMGLTKLATLESGDTYVALIEDGEIIYEESKDYEDGYASVSKSGDVLDGSPYVLKSVSESELMLLSANVSGREYTQQEVGLNVLIYDNVLERITDMTVFDVYESSARVTETVGVELQQLLDEGATLDDLSGTIKSLYLYNMRVEDEYKVKTLRNELDDTGFYQYLKEFYDSEDYVILISTQGDASAGFDEEARSALEEMGLEELSEMQLGETYVSLVDAGEVILEECSDEEVIDLQMFDYELISGEEDGSYVTSLTVANKEYGKQTDGMNVVIYNKTTGKIIDATAFDTTLYQVSVE